MKNVRVARMHGRSLSLRTPVALAVGALFGALFASERDASADPHTLVYAGVNGGVDVLPRSPVGALVGVQASVAQVADLLGPIPPAFPLVAWGGFVDAGYITHRDAGRFSLGPEAAFWTGTHLLVGAQAGALAVVDHDRPLFGFSLSPAIGPVVTIGMIWLYLRWDHEFSGDDSFQVGLMVQSPPLNLLL